MALRDYSDDDDYYDQDFRKKGVVSVWVGLRSDEGDADADVLQDFCGVGYYDLDAQESNSFNFELVNLEKLFNGISYSSSFKNNVLSTAYRKGIHLARWIVVQYEFGYDPAKVSRPIADDPIFIGYFDYSIANPVKG
ncbi:immunity 22 family protein [Undibacterium sp. CY18W]|uniref:Immunity 22 family protein n=1 Tax=Undibacterium hunanense TaxID=2762292 RepID=A0ABR6ZTA9_9BURK|nr:immunity 22 family protein [Undibacterium hunanense]MBC3919098.1 immunity 22 family protein [Undibacterium hunanense]